MNRKLKEKIMESVSAVLPITGIVLAIALFLVPMETGIMTMFITGAILLVIGMGFFQLGAEMAMTPLGEGLGIQLSRTKKIGIIVLIGFLMGAIITIAEPDLQVLAEQVPSVPNLALILTVAVGVALFLALAIVRILWKVSFSLLLIIMYGVLLGLSFLVPRDFLAVAFDSGGVTTGPITVPFIMALGIGLTSVRGDKGAADDSFGLVALSSGGPILAVLILGCFFRPDGASYTADEIAKVVTIQDVMLAFLRELPRFAHEVLISVAPIIAVFIIFQLLKKRYHSRQIKRVAVGFVYTYIGLVLFLCGVNVGFSPVGTQLGEALAAAPWNWLLVPIGMLIGYFIVKAEPAIQILNHQIQTVTNGTVKEKSMNRCLSVGVAVSVGLSMLRILTGIPIMWLLLPGYAIALCLSLVVPKIFVGIAFDSGGVASGPMTTTFLLPLSIGACFSVGGSVMTDAFGVVALVALTPLIAVQAMGLNYRIKLHRMTKLTAKAIPMPDDSDVITELEEGIPE